MRFVLTRGAVFVATLLFVSVQAAPAWAHGGGGPDASNFVSNVDAVVTRDSVASGEVANAEQVEAPGLHWAVLANDALLQLRNTGEVEVVIAGYENEDYLRVGPDGVFENRNSPATYLNDDRFADTPVPPTAQAGAEPDWVKVSDEPVYAWHDHRIHWMARTLPPQVSVNASEPVTIQNWIVPFTQGGQDLAVIGKLLWEPPPSWIPWVLGALIVLSAPVVPAFVNRGDPDERRRRALKTAAVVFWIVIAANVVHGIDDLIAVPASAGANALAALQTFVPLAIAAWATWRASRCTPGSAQALLIATLVLAIGLGLTHINVLVSSQVASMLPEWFSRAVVAANFGVIAPAVLAIVASGELRPVPEPAPEATPAEEIV